MAIVLVIMLTMLSSSTVFVAYGNKKVISSGKMSVILSVGETVNSSAANGTYAITFNAAYLGGTVTSAGILNIGTKTDSNPYIVVYWDDTF